MVPMKKIFEWWDIDDRDEENCTIQSFDEETGAPEEFGIYMTSRFHPDYKLTIDTDLNTWQISGIWLGYRSKKDFGIRGVSHVSPDRDDLEFLLEDWAKNPEKHKR